MRLSYLSILLFLILPILLFFVLRGVVMHDEGYILYSSERMLHGQLPYRDFHFVYTPLSLYATSLVFMILKPSILSSRLLILIISLLSSYLIYKTVYLSTRNKFYATLSLLLFVAWGPTHINFSWPVVYAVSTGLLTCYLLMKFIQTRSSIFLFSAGISSFMVFLAKQNFGAAIIFTVIVFFSIKHTWKFKYISSFLYGYIWSFIFFTIYLLYNSSFRQFIDDFYIFTIKRIVINSGLTTAFIYQDIPLSMIFRTSLYLLPVIVAVACLVLLFIRRRFHLLFLPVFVIAFYIVGIRPTTDYIHLVPLLSLVGIPLALYLRFNISSTLRIILILLAFFVIGLGFETAVFKGYYRWDSPLITHNKFFNNKKVNIFLNDQSTFIFSELTKISNSYTRPGDYIFVNAYSPMLYFVMDRNEPTKHNFLSSEFIPDTYYKEVKGNLIAKKVKILILPHNSLGISPLKPYIQKNYHFLKIVGDFDIFVLNP